MSSCYNLCRGHLLLRPLATLVLSVLQGRHAVSRLGAFGHALLSAQSTLAPPWHDWPLPLQSQTSPLGEAFLTRTSDSTTPSSLLHHTWHCNILLLVYCPSPSPSSTWSRTHAPRGQGPCSQLGPRVCAAWTNERRVPYLYFQGWRRRRGRGSRVQSCPLLWPRSHLGAAGSQTPDPRPGYHSVRAGRGRRSACFLEAPTGSQPLSREVLLTIAFPQAHPGWAAPRLHLHLARRARRSFRCAELPGVVASTFILSLRLPAKSFFRLLLRHGMLTLSTGASCSITQGPLSWFTSRLAAPQPSLFFSLDPPRSLQTKCGAIFSELGLRHCWFPPVPARAPRHLFGLWLSGHWRTHSQSHLQPRAERRGLQLLNLVALAATWHHLHLQTFL